jgi:predicted  nucleic acid-binding Zn-ribbon protein
MMPANESSDRDCFLERQIRILVRRITRLEETQLTSTEVSLPIDRLNARIDTIEERMNRRFEQLEARIDRLEAKFNDLDRKFDVAIAISLNRSRVSDD